MLQKLKFKVICLYTWKEEDRIPQLWLSLHQLQPMEP